MIELELFYRTAESAVRSKQAAYLKKVRSQPFEQELPKVRELSPGEYAKLTFFQRIAYFFELRKQRKARRKALKAQKYPIDEKLTRGYNAGIEAALSAFEDEFNKFVKRIEKEENK